MSRCAKIVKSSCALQANKPEYYRINAEKFLRQELSGKAVIEFPVLTVLLPGEDSKYVHASDLPAAPAEQIAAEQTDTNAVAP